MKMVNTRSQNIKSNKEINITMNKKDKFKKKTLDFINIIMKTSVFLYGTILISSVLAGGSIIRLYGNTCGINLFDPTNWLLGIIAIGSPYCKGLNWICYMITCIVEQFWLHLLGLCISSFISFFPKDLNINLPIKYTSKERELSL